MRQQSAAAEAAKVSSSNQRPGKLGHIMVGRPACRDILSRRDHGKGADASDRNTSWENTKEQPMSVGNSSNSSNHPETEMYAGTT